MVVFDKFEVWNLAAMNFLNVSAFEIVLVGLGVAFADATMIMPMGVPEVRLQNRLEGLLCGKDPVPAFAVPIVLLGEGKIARLVVVLVVDGPAFADVKPTITPGAASATALVPPSILARLAHTCEM